MTSRVDNKCDSALQSRLLRVTHLVLSLDNGGLERVVLELVRGGVGGGHDVSVICLERPGMLAGDVRNAGAAVHCLDKSPGIRPRIASGISRLLRRLRPHVIHTHQIGALAYAGPAAYWCGIPVVTHTEHGKHYSNRWKTRLLGRVASRFAHQVCCVSEDILQEVISQGVAPSTKCRFIPNGIDTSRFSQPSHSVGSLRTRAGVPADAIVVGTVGRLTEIKNQSSLLRAFAALLATFATIPFHLLIVGDGPEWQNLNQLADQLGIRNAVTFAGYQSQPELYLGLMDIFALSSRSEGMPLAVLEAWAAGLPVVATSVGGVPRLIEHGKTGLLVEFDNIGEMTASIAQLATNPELRDQLGRVGQQLVGESYGSQKMCDNYQQVYEQHLFTRRCSTCAS
jgi:sugar transferase (PEP-CTERM/EpsH1 system associated)